MCRGFLKYYIEKLAKTASLIGERGFFLSRFCYFTAYFFRIVFFTVLIFNLIGSIFWITNRIIAAAIAIQPPATTRAHLEGACHFHDEPVTVGAKTPAIAPTVFIAPVTVADMPKGETSLAIVCIIPPIVEAAAILMVRISIAIIGSSTNATAIMVADNACAATSTPYGQCLTKSFADNEV